MVALVLLGAPASAAGAAATGAPAGAEELEARFVARVADERRAQGLPALAVADDLVAVARRHSARMVGAARVFHNSALPDEVAGWVALGENVGRGPTVEELHASFMASPTHRAEVLRPGFTAVGVGVVWAGDALWVTQVFRQPAAAPAPLERRSSPPAARPGGTRRAAPAGRPVPSAATTSTTEATTTTAAATSSPPSPAAAPAATEAASAPRPPSAPVPPAVPAAGVVAAGLLWAVVAGAAGLSVRPRGAPWS